LTPDRRPNLDADHILGADQAEPAVPGASAGAGGRAWPVELQTMLGMSATPSDNHIRHNSVACSSSFRDCANGVRSWARLFPVASSSSCYVLEKGRIIKHGAPADVLADDAIRQRLSV
jgi:hypothetical protein